MITIEARNARTGRVVCTFEDSATAFAFCRDRDDLGQLEVWAVERIVRERRLDETLTIPFKGAGGLRAGRGRS